MEARLQRPGAQRTASRHVGSRLRQRRCTRSRSTERSTPLTGLTGQLRRPGRVAGRLAAWRFSAADDSQTYPQNVHVGVVPGDRRASTAGCRGSSTAPSRRRRAARSVRGSTTRPCSPPRKTAAKRTSTASRSMRSAPTPITSGADRRQLLRRRRRHDRLRRSRGRCGQRHLRASPTASHGGSRRSPTSYRAVAKPQPWERFAVPCTDGSGEIDAWIMRPADFDAALEAIPCCSTCTAARTRSTARRSSTRRRCRRRPGSSC